MKKKKIFSLCLTVSILTFIFSLCIGYIAPEGGTIYTIALSVGACSIMWIMCFWIGKLTAEKDLCFKENLKLTFENQQLIARVNDLEERLGITPIFKKKLAEQIDEHMNDGFDEEYLNREV